MCNVKGHLDGEVEGATSQKLKYTTPLKRGLRKKRNLERITKVRNNEQEKWD